MKKVMITTVLILGLSAGSSLQSVLAGSESDQQVNQESTEKNWQDALKAQVALAKAKLSLLQARSELWIANNEEAALKSLEEARLSLDEGWRSADKMTQARITALKLEVDQAKKLLSEKGQGAEAELEAIANRSESALNAALAQAQTQSAILKSEAASRYALVQAKAAALNARVALEVEQSPEKAEQALKEVGSALQQAKKNASTVTVGSIAKLQTQAQATQEAVGEQVGTIKTDIRALVVAIDAHIAAYEKRLQDSDEVKRLKNRYAHLEAQAALLKASLATKADATGGQATAYLSESKAWYENVKIDASSRAEQELAEMSLRIEEAKQAVARKDKQARAKLSALLEQAAEMVKD